MDWWCLTLKSYWTLLQFVREMVFQPTSLVELAARVIKVHDVPYEDWEVHMIANGYLF